MSRMPTLLEAEGFTFRFWSADRGEPPHVHVRGNGGIAKIWLRPTVRLASSRAYTRSQIRRIVRITEEHRGEFLAAWREHFGAR